MKIVTALLLASALAATGQAAAQGTGAATLQDLNGKVLMNTGDGLVSGRAGTALMDGDRIVTLNKSGARIIFPDGCGVTLEENMIFVINSQLGCKAAPVASNQPAAPGLTTPTQGLILGTAYVGGGAIIGNSIFNNNRHDNRPISRQ
jgi:hypothetical protein